ncbi:MULTISPECIES: hydantoinase/oxoprolinase family protein [Haloferacaceae]|uniref:Hydantoinase/oxoprolinase family protein n=1 Tax=Halorubrum glutamatedens TaxID=2707018 RepID=A0ABD5QRA7_9EURY|nr:hydantoinase/oxoprolinase family protein [Halobellus captivus]
MSEEAPRIGVDVGGTFTDVVTVQNGTVSVTKSPSTPDSPDEGVINGLTKSRSTTGIEPEAVEFFAHGTTVATNAVLEREWADTALITNEGFRDVLEIGRQARPDIYDFEVTKPEPIVSRDKRFGVPGRLDERGNIEQPLDHDAVDSVIEHLSERDLDSVAVSLLFAYENDEHEQTVAARIESMLDDVSISTSSDVLPEIREYERTLATSLNAALKPVMDRYLGRLDDRLTEEGFDTELQIMQSNGGIIDADRARTQPINTLLSGPAAGVQGAAHIAGLRGVDDVLTMDMGGTSCDVSVVTDGEPLITTDLDIGEYPVTVPMVSVHSIGAGGGSIGWIDTGGALRVGPKSAGAMPGPVCYGRGGTEPTVTDAHLYLGRLDPENLLSDELEADLDLVEAAICESLADPLGLSVPEAAQGILDVANANMERALRVVSVEQGHDPREFGLVAFGGAGPLHAAKLASELEVPRVFVPRTAGVLSALGLLITDLLHDFSTSMVRSWTEIDAESLEAVFTEFEQEGRDRLASTGYTDDRVDFERAVDVRYVGQSFEITVPVENNTITPETLEQVAERFHELHERRYGHASPAESIELVTVRLRARGLVDVPELTATDGTGTAAGAITDTREIRYDETYHETRVYDRAHLGPETTFEGPAIVEGSESTVVVHPGQDVTVDEFGTIIIEVNP